MKRSALTLNAESIPAGGIDTASALALISAAGDIALVMDAGGTIQDVGTVGGSEIAPEDFNGWVGKPWAETVTIESRRTVEAMLQEVRLGGASRARQISHAMVNGPDVSVVYTVVQLNGREGTVVAVGRDMRPMAILEHRLVETQQILERDHLRLRNFETRYRLLFQVAYEALLIVNANTRRIVDANDAASRLFGVSVSKLIGTAFPFGVDATSEILLEESLASARAVGRSSTIKVLLSDTTIPIELAVSCFRQDAASLFLVQMSVNDDPRQRESDLNSELSELFASTPDALVVTDLDGRVLQCNRAFLDLVQLAGEQQAHGRLLSEWVGRPGADLNVFLTTLRKHGVVRLLTTGIRGEEGANTEGEVTATLTGNSGSHRIGFILRDVGRRVASGPQGARSLTNAVEQLTSLVGSVALRDLLRDTSDLVERHFIKAALDLSNDNRTAAAGILGLSRQSLYVKMRRHEPRGSLDSENREVG